MEEDCPLSFQVFTLLKYLHSRLKFLPIITNNNKKNNNNNNNNLITIPFLTIKNISIQRTECLHFKS